MPSITPRTRSIAKWRSSTSSAGHSTRDIYIPLRSKLLTLFYDVSFVANGYRNFKLIVTI